MKTSVLQSLLCLFLLGATVHLARGQTPEELTPGQSSDAGAADTRSVMPDETLGMDSSTLGHGLGTVKFDHGDVTSGAAVPASGPPAVCSSGCSINNGSWFFDADVTYMLHSRPRKGVIARDFSATGAIPRDLNNASASFDFEPGMQLTLGMYLERGCGCCNGSAGNCITQDRTLEFTFDGLNDWDHGNRSLTAESTGGIFFLNNLSFPGFSGADVVNIHNTALMNSFELNYRVTNRLGRDSLVLNPRGCWTEQCTPGYTPSYLFGLRYMDIEERTDIFARRFGVSPTVFAGSYHIDATNNLFGPQTGAEIFYQNCRWKAGVSGKTALLVNLAENDSDINFVQGAVGPGDLHGDVNKQTLAFLGDVELSAAYQICTNVSVHASYDFMLVDQLALGPQQITFSPNVPDSITTNGHILYQGLKFGLEFVW